jgi:hypothetical protein
MGFRQADIDKSKEYKRIYGVNADAKFLNDYPEYFDFSASLSKNPTGVQSSVQATDTFRAKLLLESHFGFGNVDCVRPA